MLGRSNTYSFHALAELRFCLPLALLLLVLMGIGKKVVVHKHCKL